MSIFFLESVHLELTDVFNLSLFKGQLFENTADGTDFLNFIFAESLSWAVTVFKSSTKLR